MIILVGLGNIGNRYSGNRHNTGFMLVDQIADLNQVKFIKKEKLDCSIADVDSLNKGSHMLKLVKPLTYMNNSGLAVKKVLEYYKLPASNLICIHDDLELNFGEIKIKKGGGHAGHNGLRSISATINTDSYCRIRIGIGRPAHSDIAGYVLDDFTKEEKDELHPLLYKTASNFEELLIQAAS